MEKRELALAAPGKRELRVRVSDELYEGLKELQNQASGSLLTKWLSAGHAEELDYEYLGDSEPQEIPDGYGRPLPTGRSLWRIENGAWRSCTERQNRTERKAAVKKTARSRSSSAVPTLLGPTKPRSSRPEGKKSRAAYRVAESDCRNGCSSTALSVGSHAVSELQRPSTGVR